MHRSIIIIITNIFLTQIAHHKTHLKYEITMNMDKHNQWRVYFLVVMSVNGAMLFSYNLTNVNISTNSSLFVLSLLCSALRTPCGVPRVVGCTKSTGLIILT